MVLAREDGCPPKKRAASTRATLVGTGCFRRRRSVPCFSGRIGQFLFKLTHYPLAYPPDILNYAPLDSRARQKEFGRLPRIGTELFSPLESPSRFIGMGFLLCRRKRPAKDAWEARNSTRKLEPASTTGCDNRSKSGQSAGPARKIPPAKRFAPKRCCAADA